MYVYAFAHSLVFNALCRGQRSGAIQFALFGQLRASVGPHKEIQCVPHTTGSMSANCSLGIHILGSNSLIYGVACTSTQESNICSVNL